MKKVMKGTCEELYNKGFLREYNYYFENKYYTACKKFLFFKFKYKVGCQELLMFKGKFETDFGEEYRFIYKAVTNRNCGIEFPSGTLFCGKNSEMNLKKLKRVKFYY